MSTFPFSSPNGDGLGSPPAPPPLPRSSYTPRLLSSNVWSTWDRVTSPRGFWDVGGWGQWEDDVQGCGFKDECWDWYPWCMSW